jgi:hypothetical protein
MVGETYMKEDRLNMLALRHRSQGLGAYFVVNEEFPEKTQILAIQLKRQDVASNRQTSDLQAAEPHLSPIMCSYPSDKPSVRVAAAYRRMTFISKAFS